jgi:sugar lactone lactonase YvrE
MNVNTYDETICRLGEGPLWHPLRQELFWFDITGKKLYRRQRDQITNWQFAEHVSAAGWVDHDTLLVASQSSLSKFDIVSGKSEVVVLLDSDNPLTRSNDGRADPWGGFWIGTMGINAESEAGAIYRYYRGELRVLYEPITVSNSICFSPDRTYGYYSDTRRQIIWRQELNEADGWPVGEPKIYLDFTGTKFNPDGAVCDSDGYLWSAQWGSARLVRYTRQGNLDTVIILPTDHITCPAFGGSDLRTLFATSATQGLNDRRRAEQPLAGKTFSTIAEVAGQKEHQVIL